MNSSIFKTFFLSLCIIANVHFAYGQTASILPPAKTTFVDQNGKPLTSGTVDFYIPSTANRKTTWQDAAETIPNTNPVVLDAAGRALILGSGSYRQVVKDRNKNTIWDQVTSSAGAGGTSPASTGDGDLVGTIKPWAGMTAPNQYVFTYGQEVSRIIYATLYTTITSNQSVFCSSGSPILTGLTDTTNIPFNADIELSCVVSGAAKIISKTSNTITLNANANVNTNTTAVIFPWGHGNGATTFNIPDFRGFAIAGNNNMGGVASPILTTTFYGSNPNATGAAGGNQSVILNSSNIPSLSASNPATAAVSVTSTSSQVLQSAGPPDNFTSVAGSTTFDNQTRSAITSTGSIAKNLISTNTDSGGMAVSATVGAVGSGYTNGAQTITVAGGTCSIQPQFTVTVSGNAFSGTPALLTAGNCTVAPVNAAATTGGGGTGGTLNVIYSAQSISLIQPTKTSNYIIKITPDSNSSADILAGNNTWSGNNYFGSGIPWVDIRSGTNGCAAAVPYDPMAPVDATAAIQCQLTFMKNTYSGGTVFVSPGIYLISGGGVTVPAGVWLIGTGIASSALAVLSDTTVVSFSISSGTCPSGNHNGGMEKLYVSGYVNPAATQATVHIGGNCNVTLRDTQIFFGASALSNDGVDSIINDSFIWGYTAALTSGGANHYHRVKFDQPGATSSTYGYHQTANIAGLSGPENFFIDCDFSGTYTYSVKIDSTGNTAITHFTQGVFSSPIVATTSLALMINNSEIGSTTFTVTAGSLMLTGSYGFNPTTVTGAGTRSCAGNINITC